MGDYMDRASFLHTSLKNKLDVHIEELEKEISNSDVQRVHIKYGLRPATSHLSPVDASIDLVDSLEKSLNIAKEIRSTLCG
jgi:hypothetical protein